jgi:hypothetical protein
MASTMVTAVDIGVRRRCVSGAPIHDGAIRALSSVDERIHRLSDDP